MTVKTPKQALEEAGYITAKAAAERIGYSVQGIYKMINEKRIEGTTIGRMRYVKYSSLRSYMQKVAPEAAKAAKL